jgi:flagellar biosynthesis protein FlhG
MAHDQADELRRLARLATKPGLASGPAPRLIGVSGGQSGVGASTIAFNLTVALARLGHRAMWIDADLEHGGAAGWGLSSATGSFLDVLRGRRSIHEALERGPAGIQMLGGAWSASDATNIVAAAEQRFVDELRHLGLHADVIVLDLGSGRAHFAWRIWQAADLAIVVTGSDKTAIMETYATIKILVAGDAAAPVQLLVNFADEARGKVVHERIAGVCRQFLGLPLVAPFHLPDSPSIREANAAGKSFLWPTIGGEPVEQAEHWAEEVWSRMRSVSLHASKDKKRAA